MEIHHEYIECRSSASHPFLKPGPNGGEDRNYAKDDRVATALNGTAPTESVSVDTAPAVKAPVEFASAIGVALLAPGGECVDLGLFENTSIEAAGSWAIEICRIFGQGGSQIPHVLMISVGTATPTTIYESDLALFRSIRSGLSAVGTKLLDWIETDGDHVRSFAQLTYPVAGWIDDPNVEP